MNINKHLLVQDMRDKESWMLFEHILCISLHTIQKVCQALRTKSGFSHYIKIPSYLDSYREKYITIKKA